ncbi:MAG: hypothetical protein ABSD99_01875 [Candidatus Bathyarchaeia archaeon]
MEESGKRYGKPRQILTDRGTQFYPTRGGMSKLTEFSSGNGIEHIVASVRMLSTIGGLRRFIRRTSAKHGCFPHIKSSYVMGAMSVHAKESVTPIWLTYS